MKNLGKRTKLLLVSTAIIIALILLAIVFFPSIFNFGNSGNPAVQYYNLNQEITGVPAGNTSITFTSWTYTSSFGIHVADQNKNLVIINFTLRNIADTEIETSTNLQYLPEAEAFTPREAPFLKYGDSHAKAETDFPYSYYWGLWTTQNTILPNESVAGYLIYKIPQENTPTELVFPNADSPKIIISL